MFFKDMLDNIHISITTKGFYDIPYINFSYLN